MAGTKKQKLKIATTQFPVSGDVNRNARYVIRFIREAAANGADLVQFCEAALSGYGLMDFPSFDGYNWDLLRAKSAEVMAAAKECDTWVALGSSHYISPKTKPTNCIYIVNNKGRIVDRFDKCFVCTPCYTSGNHFTTLTLKGVTMGFLICYDGSFPEMYAAYRSRGVTVMLHSFYNARHDGPNVLSEMVPAQILTRAADNAMWVVACNSSGRHSSWPTRIARPDGSLAQSLSRHKSGILYHEFPDDELRGWLHNSKLIKLHKDEVFHNRTPSRHPRALDTKAMP